jgi:hypothetical protein
MTSPLDELHGLLGDAAFNRVRDAFPDHEAGVNQLTDEWAALPPRDTTATPVDVGAGTSVKVAVRDFLPGWWPCKVQDYRHTRWIEATLTLPSAGYPLNNPLRYSDVAYITQPPLERPKLSVFDYGLEYYADELDTLAGYFAAWPD